MNAAKVLTARGGRHRTGMSDLPELCDIDRLAKYLGVTRHYMYRLTREHRIRYQRIGRELRFGAEDVLAWLDTEAVPVATEKTLNQLSRPPRGRPRNPDRRTA
jgi:excisionase family DNA binding protein